MFTVAIALLALSQTSDPLRAGFQNPPLSARPHTWWHWMNGNVTKEGITADLEAMKQAGIGGAQMFTVDQGIPAGKAGYGGPLWREMTAFAVKEADRLGLVLCIHNCAGWSSSGGPWNTPAHGMQVLAWSTKTVSGGPVDTDLDPIKAPKVYSNVPYSEDIAVFAIPGTPATFSPQDFLGRTGVVRQDGLVPNLESKPGTPTQQILNLTPNLRDGHLTCTLPEGNWTLLRMGHVPTGIDNHPAPPEGDGLEVDKLSREALKAHWDGLMGKVIHDAGPLTGKSLNNALIDSYEVGSQNWTPKLREDFQRLRGYDPLPYLPAMAGFVVSSGPITERFLWDYRRTIADLFAENYFGYFGELCHANGLKFSTEPYGDGGFDDMQAGGTADIPMGEFWLGGLAMESTKMASSIGHTYGRPVIGAESFTADESRGRFLEEPYMMKTVGDLAFINGINRYIFHRYAMQPWLNFKPGMTMGPWGTHLDRTQTWWTEAATWLKYVGRSQYLLQSGRFVADAVVFSGETAPIDLAYARGAGRIVPEGYDYDGCDTRILMSMSVKDGQITLPGGMRYRLLILPKSPFMTPKVARKIRDLVLTGANVVGPRPTHTPSLTGFPSSESELLQIADRVWGNQPVHMLGKGRVFGVATPGEALAQLRVQRDFAFSSPGAQLLHLHRQIGNTEVYFVSNQRYKGAFAQCDFRVTGKQPELWYPQTGRTELAPVWRAGAGVTSVSLKLDPAESVFVVFRGKPHGSHLSAFQPVWAPAPKSLRLSIVAARYEAEDGRGRDVTPQVRDLVAGGTTEIEVNNGNFGDPALNSIKHLTLKYQLGSQTKTVTVAENDSVQLSSDGGPAGIPDYDIVHRNGSLVVYPWQRATWKLGSPGKTLRSKNGGETLDLNHGWNVSFAPNLGAPKQAKFNTLSPWNSNENTGIKYFSGSAVYRREFSYGTSKDGSKRVRLDLGSVKNFATVTLNGKPLGTLWKPPFAVDITSAVKPGKNHLEVKVTNLWVNRLIGDEQLPADVEWNGTQLKEWPAWLVNHQPRPKTGRITFVTWHFYNKNSPLLDSGLIGPVRVQTASGIKVE